MGVRTRGRPFHFAWPLPNARDYWIAMKRNYVCPPGSSSISGKQSHNLLPPLLSR